MTDKSQITSTVIWDYSSHRQAAVGSDLWPITWADDDNLYTVWGDGGGFGGIDSEERVTLGMARIAGDPDKPNATNIFGGKNPEAPPDLNGKSNGLISINGVLYIHVVEEGKWLRAKIGRSTDHGKIWIFNSSPAKWLSADGKRFVMVWSGTGKYDSWNTLAGSFSTS